MSDVSISNSGAIKQRIAELRRMRASSGGKIDRAYGAISLLRKKIADENSKFIQAGLDIERLGGKIRKP